MKGQEVAIPRAEYLRQHMGLLSRGELYYRRSVHRWASLNTQVVSQLLMYQRVHLCANLLWSDLAYLDVTPTTWRWRGLRLRAKYAVLPRPHCRRRPGIPPRY